MTAAALLAVLLAVMCVVPTMSSTADTLPAPPPDTTLRGKTPGGGFGFALGGLGDVNGDGFDDIAVTAAAYARGTYGYMAHDDTAEDKPKRVFVFYGSRTGIPENPALSLAGENMGEGFGRTVAGAGDINGDGFADLLVAAPEAGDEKQGIVYVFLGGNDLVGSLSGPAFTLLGQEPNGVFGHSLAGLGDVNGDGFDDIAVSAPGAADLAGSVYIFHGGPQGLHAAPDTTIPGAFGESVFGTVVAGAGDVNGDGFSDLAVSGVGGDYGGGRVYVFHGSPSGIDGAPPYQSAFHMTSREALGIAMAGADVNGDGFSDLAVTSLRLNRRGPAGTSYALDAGDPGTVLLFYGGDGGISGTLASPRGSVVGEHPGDLFGGFLAAAGDVNGDGYDDLVASAPGFAASNLGANTGATGTDAAPAVGATFGKLYVLFGGADGPAATASAGSFSVAGMLSAAMVRYPVAGAGDIDGDGRADVVAGNAAAGDGAGAVDIYTGATISPSVAGAWGLPTATPSHRLTPPAGPTPYPDDASAGDDTPERSSAAEAVTTEASLFGPTGDLFGEFAMLAAASGDVNADGIPDLLVGAGDFDGQRGKVYLFYGGPGSFDAPVQPVLTIAGEHPGDTFGRAVAIGDFDGDGSADLAVGAPGFEEHRGQVYVYSGGAAGPDKVPDVAAPAMRVIGDWPYNELGQAIAAVGDVNGDGYGDLAAGAYGYASWKGMLVVFHGGPDGLGSAEDGAEPLANADFTAFAEGALNFERYDTSDNFGIPLAGGDFNCDGYTDLVTAAASYGVDYETRQQGKVYVFSGGPNGLTGANAGEIVAPAFTATGGQSLELFGDALATGDLNGDGCADLAVGSSYGYGAVSGRVYIFHGSPTGLARAGDRAAGAAEAVADLTLSGLATGDFDAEELFGAALAIDDFDGDGYDDLLAGAPKSDAWRGRVYFLPGGPGGLADTEPGPYPSESSILRAGAGPEMLGMPLVSAGDVDGDGLPEAVAGASLARGMQGEVYIFDVTR